MRQYRVYFRSKTAEEWATLEPGAHVGIYDNPAVNAALQVIRDQPAIEGVVCRHAGNRLLNAERCHPNRPVM